MRSFGRHRMFETIFGSWKPSCRRYSAHNLFLHLLRTGILRRRDLFEAWTCSICRSELGRRTRRCHLIAACVHSHTCHLQTLSVIELDCDEVIIVAGRIAGASS